MTDSAIRIIHITVKSDRVIAQVEVADERHAYTTPSLITALLPAYPHLLEHACVNDCGTTFGAVARRTSLPHLLEHMAIENQVRAEADAEGAIPNGQRTQAQGDESHYQGARGAAVSPATYMGKTRWTDRARRMAHVELSYADDLVALAALRDAARDLNAAIALEEATHP